MYAERTLLRGVLIPVVFGLLVLFLNIGTVPSVSETTLRLAITPPLIGFILFVIQPSTFALRLGTAGLLVLAAIRVYGYLTAHIWNPAGVWVITLTFAFLAYGHIRDRLD